MSEQNYYSPDQYAQSTPTLSPSEERNLGMLAHLIPLVATIFSAGTLGFVGSLIIYVMYKDRGPFVRAHAANSLNVQLTFLVWLVGALVMAFTIVLIPISLVIWGVGGLMVLVMHVVGAIKGNNGEFWNPPLTIRFVS